MTQNQVTRSSRREFMGGAVAGGVLLGTVGIQETNAFAAPQGKLPQDAVVLFQGDSITDAGRDKNATAANHQGGLGDGYAMLLAAGLLADHAGSKLKIFNRGISGHKVPDLAARWQSDTVDLKPNVLSILIGVNDIWHKLNGNYKGTVADYETGYRELLKKSVEAIPGVRLVICEPFVLRCGAINDKWFPEFDQRREVARKLAEEQKATLVPFQSMFDEAAKLAPPEYWAGDGVHPTLAGHALMAKTWRSCAGL